MLNAVSYLPVKLSHYMTPSVKPAVSVFAKKSSTNADKVILMGMVEKSKKLMEEYGTLFKSKTLETLYTPEYQYHGMLPNTTYIIDKKTGDKKKMMVYRMRFGGENFELSEKYTGRTLGFKALGSKMFGTKNANGDPELSYGVMQSYKNNRYAGTQIRLTQVEVERAIQLEKDSIPLVSVPEALPFHTMMGFRPVEKNTEVSSVEDVDRIMRRIIDSSCIKKEHITPIVHCKDDKFYLDENQTVANALLRHFKDMKDSGVERDFHSVFPGNMVDMELKGKELEAWKQRAISQPIYLSKRECKKIADK